MRTMQDEQLIGLFKSSANKLQDEINELAKLKNWLGETSTPIAAGDTTSTIIVDGESIDVSAGDVARYQDDEFIYSQAGTWQLYNDEIDVYTKDEADARFMPTMVDVLETVITSNAAAAPLVAAKIDILPIQAGSGVPSPTNIRALSAHESVTLKHSVSGKLVYDSYEAEFDTPVWVGGFDFVSGELVSGCAAVDMGDLTTYPVSGQDHVFALKLPDNVKDISGFSINSTWCSMYDGYSSESMSDLGNYRYTMFKAAEDIGAGFAAGDIGILVRDDRFDIVPDFSTAVNGQTFVYPLATPLVENVDVGPIIMHEGTNTLWCDDAGGELGKNVEAEWYVNNSVGNAIGRVDGKFAAIADYDEEAF